MARDDDPLSATEDGELRRLASLREFGLPAGSLTSRMTELRQRDRRSSVRAPRQDDVTSVVEDRRV